MKKKERLAAIENWEVLVSFPEFPSYFYLHQAGVEIPTEENLNSVKSLFNRHLHCTLGKDLKVATAHDFYLAFAYTVRDFVMDRWKHTQDIYYAEDPKVMRRNV